MTAATSAVQIGTGSPDKSGHPIVFVRGNSIRKLPERTQTVLALYFQEDCTQAEIGEILGVTESRVCQILGEAAARIRASLARDERARPRARSTR